MYSFESDFFCSGYFWDSSMMLCISASRSFLCLSSAPMYASMLSRWFDLTLGDPMDYSPPGPSVHGISQQEYWSRLPFPSPGDPPDQGSNPDLLHSRHIFAVWATREYTEELYKKGLNDLDKRDGVIIHLELDILECEVKWA